MAACLMTVALLCSQILPTSSAFQLHTEAGLQVRPSVIETLSLTTNNSVVEYFDTILRPLLEGRYVLKHFHVSLSYGPRILDRLPPSALSAGNNLNQSNLTNSIGLQLFHRFRAELGFDLHQALVALFRATLNLGAADLSSLGDIEAELESVVTETQAGQVVAFSTLVLTLSLDQRLLESLHLVSLSSVRMVNFTGSPSVLAQVVSLTPQVGMQADHAVLDWLATGVRLLNQKRYEETLSLIWTINDQHSLTFQNLFSYINYPGKMLYLALTPAFIWQWKASDWSDLKLRAGVLKAWRNPIGGILLKSLYVPVAELILNYRFVPWGISKLSSQISIGMLPYFDSLFGEVYPRQTLRTTLGYDFTRKLHLALTFQFYTTDLYRGQSNISIQNIANLPSSYNGDNLFNGRFHDLYSLRLSLTYNLYRWMIFDAGWLGSIRERIPSLTLSSYGTRQTYVFLGIKFVFDVK